MTAIWKNKLYYGDNLDIMREHMPDESVDLIYLDPPFNSKATYNVLFSEKNGTESRAQITAFEDTWQWGQESEQAYRELVTQGPKKLADLVQALRGFLGTNDMMAYLVMMAIRLVEMHRALKPTGSIYLHCDPTASHYLKLVMDAVFGVKNFRNDIVWCYRERERSIRKYNPKHDCLLFYVKDVDSEYIFNDEEGRTRFSIGTIEKFKYTDEQGRKFQIRGRNVAGSPYAKNQGLPIELETSAPELVYRDYVDKASGVSPRDWIAPPMGNPICPECRKEFTDNLIYFAAQVDPSRYPVAPINRAARERLSYPTQKPESLLEYLICISSNEGDIVMDPFCGCGTTIAVAERLNRNWIGIDITHLAITLMKHRLEDTFGPDLSLYEVHGDPKDLHGAKALAEHDRYQFEWWALGKVAARPAQDRKKGADSGVDGYIYFIDDTSGKAKKIVVQVKSGHVNRGQVATLKGDMEREQAAIGAFITLQKPTKPMKEEAATAGFYVPEHFPDKHYPRLQILTIEELLNGKQLEYPRVAPDATFKKAERKRKGEGPKQTTIF